jgi:hypothetical protein
VLSYSAKTSGSADQAWALMARPALWSRWAPHLRGAWGLGSPEVRQGARGAARPARRGAPCPPAIVDISPPAIVDVAGRPRERSSTAWTPTGGGSSFASTSRRPARRGRARGDLRPVVQLLVKNLARVAAAR